MNTLPDRLKFAREQLNLSQQQVADAVGMKQPSYYQLEAGKSKRSRFINDIAKVLKTNADWLMYGEGEYKLDQIGTENLAESSDAEPHPVAGKDFKNKRVCIKYLDMKTSCGPGYVNGEHPENVTQLVSVDFLRQNDLPTDGSGLVLMHACSDSMGYTIPHGSLLLVDTKEREFDDFISDKVYVFRADNEMMCKRAIRNLDGTVLLTSDNRGRTTYPDQTVDRDTFSQLDMWGRVRYAFTPF